MPANILFILLDDLGAGGLGCFQSTFSQTPRRPLLAQWKTEVYAKIPEPSRPDYPRLDPKIPDNAHE